MRFGNLSQTKIIGQVSRKRQVFRANNWARGFSFVVFASYVLAVVAVGTVRTAGVVGQCGLDCNSQAFGIPKGFNLVAVGERFATPTDRR